MLQRDQIDQAEWDITGNIYEHVDITVGASCAADYRPKKRERGESTLTQRLLERSEFGNDFVLPGRFTIAPRGRRPSARSPVGRPRRGEARSAE